MSLRGKTAVVTGGGRGIGRAIALGLGAEGATVAVMSRTESELEAVVAEAKELGGDGIAIPVDAMDGPALKRAVAEAHPGGTLDILVNNVGGLLGTPAGLSALDHDDDLFEQNIALNLTSAYYATRAALPLMVAGGYGRVITIGSGYATHGGGTISYSAAKHGLVGLTHALAYQVPAGITVNCLCPGWTNTDVLSWSGRGPRPGRRQSQGPHRPGPRHRARGAGPDGRPPRLPRRGRDHRSGDQRRRRLQSLIKR